MGWETHRLTGLPNLVSGVQLIKIAVVHGANPVSYRCLYTAPNSVVLVYLPSPVLHRFRLVTLVPLFSSISSSFREVKHTTKLGTLQYCKPFKQGRISEARSVGDGQPSISDSEQMETYAQREGALAPNADVQARRQCNRNVPFTCPVPGCERTFTRYFGLTGLKGMHQSYCTISI